MLRFRSVPGPACLLILICLTGSLRASPPEVGLAAVDLDGVWRFLAADDPAMAAADYDDSGWDSLNPWEGGYEALRPGYQGNSWFRTRFTVSPGASRTGLALYLPHRGWSV
ncbi:MAG: hypothetical protein RIF32_07845, partial [Leptospirales bacterium]